jgi:hypothetical protein
MFGREKRSLAGKFHEGPLDIDADGVARGCERPSMLITSQTGVAIF